MGAIKIVSFPTNASSTAARHILDPCSPTLAITPYPLV